MNTGDKMRKVFATDYDGTLFQYETVSKKDLQTIQKFRAEGGLFGIATGRMIASIKAEIIKYDIPVDFVIGINGGVTLNSDYEEIHSLTINKETAIAIKDYLIEKSATHASISDGYHVYSEGHVSEYLEKYNISYDEIIDNDIKGLYSKFNTVDESRFVCDHINETYGDEVKALPNYEYIDIASSKTDKAIALEKYLERFKKVDVATAGDAHNDLMMLKKYKGYAMKHGDADIVNQIDRKVRTVHEALEDFMKG